MRNKVLLIEDDPGLAIPLKDFFEDHGLEVYLATNGLDGLALFAEKKPDIVLLDIILPDRNGFEIIKIIRDKDLFTPFILITGTEFSDANQVKAYEMGSLNFMQKPIVPQAVLALIQHILLFPKGLKKYKIGSSYIEVHSQTITIDSKHFQIREKDSRLLQFLLERKGQLVERETLLKQIWLDDHPKNQNLLDGAVLRLRTLLKECPAVKIRSVYGAGYIIDYNSN